MRNKLLIILMILPFFGACSTYEKLADKDNSRNQDFNDLQAACIDADNHYSKVTTPDGVVVESKFQAGNCRSLARPKNATGDFSDTVSAAASAATAVGVAAISGYSEYKVTKKNSETAVDIAEINRDVSIAEIDADSERLNLLIEALAPQEELETTTDDVEATNVQQ